MFVLRSAGWRALPDQGWPGNSINRLDAQCPHNTDTGTLTIPPLWVTPLSAAAGSGEPSLAHEQPHKQDDHNYDSDFVDGIHGSPKSVALLRQARHPFELQSGTLTQNDMGV